MRTADVAFLPMPIEAVRNNWNERGSRISFFSRKLILTAKLPSPRGRRENLLQIEDADAYACCVRQFKKHLLVVTVRMSAKRDQA